MAISDAAGVRHVRCPRCQSVLQEPNAPVYQCGACGTSLRAKNYTGNAQSLGSGLPPQSKHLGSNDAATTSASTTPDAPDAGPTSRHEAGDLVSESERKHVPEQVPSIEKKERDQSTIQGADGSSEPRRGRDAGGAECIANVRSVRATLSKRSRYEAESKNSEKRSEAQHEPDAAAELLDSEKRGGAQQPGPDAASKKGSGEVAPASAHAAADSSPAPAPAVPRRGDDAAASPPRRAFQPQNLSPLHKKILRTVDELKGDLSELFTKSPEVQPRSPARPPRHPKQEGRVSRSAMAIGLPTSTARHAAAAVYRPSKAGHVAKHRQVAPVGLPSRRYRRCRAADPCCHSVHPRCCHHSCCSHGKPECSSCRGHCCRPRAPAPAPKEAKRRAPPRNHCRPVLKGAPFIVCSSCFELVQVPADFAVANRSVRRLRCGGCSAVLSYSYRDPSRKKQQQQLTDQCSTDGSEARRPVEPFSFFEDFGHGVSYSTEDEQPLHVSRNSSFDTVDEVAGVGVPQSLSLHRLMGYGSASELLFRQHSPDLYESFDKRTAPDAGQYDRKGKGVCLDVDTDGDDDSDEEYGGALRRSFVKGAASPLPGQGAIRIR